MSRQALRWTLLATLLTAAVSFCGCGSARVHPWDRDLLAEKRMSFNATPRLRAIDDHIYFSKEASTGGQDVSGGGCGCN
jgi:hypothetical protein